MVLDDLDLSQLLIGAAESPPSSRIEFRDPIARYGEEAIKAVAPWLDDQALAAFAIRVIRRSADFGARDLAVTTLRSVVDGFVEPHRSDVQRALEDLGVRPPRSRSLSTRSADQSLVISSDDLVVGRVYRRKDLHDSGLGGNRQKGISYGAEATEVLLLSDPGTREEWGYRDSWQGSDRYLYYGEWSGPGDMTFTGGNRAIVDRSPELHLFTRVSSGHQYAGRFALDSWEIVSASRDGRPWKAIVFRLMRD